MYDCTLAMLFHDTVRGVALQATATPVGAATRWASNSAGLAASSASVTEHRLIRFIESLLRLPVSSVRVSLFQVLIAMHGAVLSWRTL